MTEHGVKAHKAVQKCIQYAPVTTTQTSNAAILDGSNSLCNRVTVLWLDKRTILLVQDKCCIGTVARHDTGYIQFHVLYSPTSVTWTTALDLAQDRMESLF
jgi:hypothetical protein